MWRYYLGISLYIVALGIVGTMIWGLIWGGTHWVIAIRSVIGVTIAVSCGSKLISQGKEIKEERKAVKESQRVCDLLNKASSDKSEL